MSSEENITERKKTLIKSKESKMPIADQGLASLFMKEPEKKKSKGFRKRKKN